MSSKRRKSKEVTLDMIQRSITWQAVSQPSEEEKETVNGRVQNIINSRGIAKRKRVRDILNLDEVDDFVDETEEKLEKMRAKAEEDGKNFRVPDDIFNGESKTFNFRYAIAEFIIARLEDPKTTYAGLSVNNVERTLSAWRGKPLTDDELFGTSDIIEDDAIIEEADDTDDNGSEQAPEAEVAA